MLLRHGLLQRSSTCFQCAIRNRILTFQQQRGRQNSARNIRKNEPSYRTRGPASPRLPEGRYMRPGVSETDVAKEIYHCLRGLKEDALQSVTKSGQLGSLLEKRANIFSDTPNSTLAKQWRNFEASIMLPWGGLPSSRHSASDRIEPIRAHKFYSSATFQSELQRSFKSGGQELLALRLKVAFQGFLASANMSARDLESQKQLADLRYPTEWFPGTRLMKRTVHMHIGPTNSGKTYQALRKLEEANTGIYAGPLRLLAHEVYSRLNAKGKLCNLVTGEEVRHSPHIEIFSGEDVEVGLTSCTVEMVNVNRPIDVAVIDEIQMIGDADRGWAWTQALLGVKAKEIHLCGEPRALPIVKELCGLVGDELVVHNYQRLSPLKMAERSLGGNLRLLRKGDCVISFSVMGIHAMRKQIETATGKKVAVVYGSLPPETRAQQARLFNDPNNDYDYLVASDAVGMGLNLAIKRVIFESATKFDGTKFITLATADIKQIGGRAGRFRTAAQATGHVETAPLAAAKGDAVAGVELASNVEEKSPQDISTPPVPAEEAKVTLDSLQPDLSTTLPPAPEGEDESENGLVTTLQDFDFPIVQRAMNSEPPPIKTAGLFVPDSILERFDEYFPKGTPFSYVLARLHDLVTTHPRFHLCGHKDSLWLADLVQPVENLSAADRNTICAAPASRGESELWMQLMPALARCIAEQKSGDILDIMELPLEILEMESSNSREYLRHLEKLHKGIVSWLWLSYRFAGIYTGRATAMHIKGLVEEKIETALSKISVSEKVRQAKLDAQKRAALAAQMALGEAAEGDEAAVQPEVDEESFFDPDVVRFTGGLRKIDLLGTRSADFGGDDIGIADADTGRDGETEQYLRDVLEKREHDSSTEVSAEGSETDLSSVSSIGLGSDHAGFDEDFEEYSPDDTAAKQSEFDATIAAGKDEVIQDEQKRAAVASG